MKWRLIEQETYAAAMNMAIDHAIYESVANEREKPTIRFYKWLNNSISLGAYQNHSELNLGACKKYNIETVRRMTGGRAVYHDKVDFTYSVIAHIRAFNYSVESAYREICFWIIDSLKELGINAKLENKNDITVDGKKISGNAAKAMEHGVYLQHGTLIYDLDLEIVPKVLNVTPDIVQQRAVSILQCKNLGQKEVNDALRKNFTFNKDIKTAELSKYEWMRALDLSKTTYGKISLPAGTFVKYKGACYVERGN